MNLRAILFLGLVIGSKMTAQPLPTMHSRFAAQDAAPNLDPQSEFWTGAPATHFDADPDGRSVPGNQTEVRSRWTSKNLYLLFICHFDELTLKPNPQIKSKTDKLWDWDVAEAFIGSDFAHIERYKEFEVSPQGEWVDLDIDVKQPLPGGGIHWNSGMTARANIDQNAKIWYGAMVIPMSAIAPEGATALRINLFRCGGSEPNRKLLCWRPTHERNFHVPRAFGQLLLER